MLNLTKYKTFDEQSRVFRNAVKPNANDKGFVIQYAEGNFGDEIGLTKIGKLARELSDTGAVYLVQKKLGFERFAYWAVVK